MTSVDAGVLQQLQDALQNGFAGLDAITRSLDRARTVAYPDTAGEVEAALAAGVTLRMHFATGKQGPVGLWLMLVMPSDEVVQLLHVPAPDAAPANQLTH